jgi:Phosphotransferase enzyme family
VPAEDSITGVPRAVLGRLGRSPRDLGRLGSSRVLHGNGLVLKTGPPDRAAREAFVVGELAESLPLRVPALVDAGSGWLLLGAVDHAEIPHLGVSRKEAISDLARLHDALVSAPVLADARLRGVTGRELPELLEQSVELAARSDLPEPLRLSIAEPAPLLAALSEPITLVHGDAWPGNVLRTPDGGRCWIDWEEAGAGHAALDLANWLHGSPWVPPSPDPDRDLAVYLAARTTAVDKSGFRRAVDAAVVLLFVLLDLRGIAGSREKARRELTERRAATARRFSSH